MATSSITHNFVVKSKAGATTIISALQQAEQENKKVRPVKPVFASTDTLRKMRERQLAKLNRR